MIDPTAPSLSEGATRRYLVRTRREYTLSVEAPTPEAAHDIASRTDVAEWDAGEWEPQEVDED